MLGDHPAQAGPAGRHERERRSQRNEGNKVGTFQGPGSLSAAEGSPSAEPARLSHCLRIVNFPLHPLGSLAESKSRHFFRFHGREPFFLVTLHSCRRIYGLTNICDPEKFHPSGGAAPALRRRQLVRSDALKNTHKPS